MKFFIYFHVFLIEGQILPKYYEKYDFDHIDEIEVLKDLIENLAGELTPEQQYQNLR